MTGIAAPAGLRLLERALNARLDADDEAAVVLELVLRAEDLRLRRVHLRDVGLEAPSSASLTGRCCALVVSRSMITSSWRW